MRKIGFALGIALFVASGVWLLAAPVVGPVSIAPQALTVGPATIVTVTALIQDPTLIPTSVNLQRIDAAGKILGIVGTLNDSGLNGDAVTGDKIFTVQWSVQPTAIGQLRYQVSAGFRGLLRRVASAPVVLEVTAPPLSVHPTVESTEPASATIGLLGGTLSMTGADRTQYTLTVPAGALRADQEISMLPLIGLAGLPSAGTFVAGVRLLPDGLIFAIPAELTIEVTTPIGSSGVVLGYAYRGDGEQFHARPATVNGNSITLYIRHFSGNGAFTAGAATCAALQTSPPNNPEDLREQTLACEAFVDDARRRYAEDLLYDWRNTVRPSLSAACTTEALAAAGGLYGVFLKLADLVNYDDYPELLEAVGEGRELLQGALSCVQATIERACTAADTCSEVIPLLNELLWLERFADTWGLLANGMSVVCGGLLGVSLERVTEPIPVGATRAISATFNSRFGPPVLTWSSQDPGIASVVPSTGAVTGVTPGTAAIDVSAVLCGWTAFEATDVTTVKVVDSIVITSSPQPISVGYTATLRAVYAHGAPITNKFVSWTIPDGLALTYQDSTSVTVRGERLGDFTIGAELDGFHATATVTVTGPMGEWRMWFCSASLPPEMCGGTPGEQGNAYFQFCVRLAGTSEGGSVVQSWMPCFMAVNSPLGNYTIQNGQITMRFNIHGGDGGLPQYELTGLYGDPLMGGQGHGLPGTFGAFTPPFIWRAVRTR